MFVTQEGQRTLPPVGQPDTKPISDARNTSNLGDLKTVLCRCPLKSSPLADGDREQQFVVLSAAQCEQLSILFRAFGIVAAGE